MTTVTLRSGAASQVSSARPGLEYGRVARMTVKSTTDFGYIRFGLGTQLRPGVIIQSATLQLQQVGTWTNTVSAQRAAKSWRAGTLNSANQPGVTGTAVSATRSGTTLEFAVGADVQTMIDNGTNYGWRISTASAIAREIKGFEAATGIPVLTVVYSYPPAKPTSLIPSGSAVSRSKPTLQWEAGDFDSFLVQIDPTGAFTAPTFDSGWRTSTKAELDLATTTYGGITSGATSWRVKVRKDGVESDWSAIATFPYQAKAPITFVQPGASVWESSPPLDIDMTGLTAVRYFVAKESDPSTVLYDSDLVPTTTGQHIPSAPVFLDDGAVYRVTAWGYDAVLRADTPLDPPYSIGATTTTLTTDATVTGVSNLAVTQPGPAPKMTGTFTRATPPDAITIKRADGTVLYDQEPYTTLFTSGTSYTFSDWTARPNVANTYQVQAVVNGTSSAAATFTVTPRVESRWIVDPETGGAVFIDGTEGTRAQPERVVIHELENSPYVVRRRFARRKAEGTLQGVLRADLVTFPAYPLDVMAARLTSWAEGDPGKVFRLIQGTENLAVWLGEVVLFDDPEMFSDEPFQSVSLAYWTARPS